MAIQKRFPHQMPFVATATQAEKVNQVADAEGISKADVIRRAIDAFFGLRDGEDQEVGEDAK